MSVFDMCATQKSILLMEYIYISTLSHVDLTIEGEIEDFKIIISLTWT